MKLLLPTLVLAAAAAHAQTAPVVPAAKAGEVGRISLGYVDSGDTDGFRVGVTAGLVKDLFLEAAFADVSGATAAGDFRAYDFGIGTRLPFGAGKAALSAHLGSLDSDNAALNGDQFHLRAAYAVEIAKGLEAELSLTHTFNDIDGGADDLTAPALTLRYVVGNGLGLEFSASSEDALSRTDTGEGSWSLAAVYAF
jgi:opacity protein-like surface antigen